MLLMFSSFPRMKQKAISVLVTLQICSSRSLSVVWQLFKIPRGCGVNAIMIFEFFAPAYKRHFNS